MKKRTVRRSHRKVARTPSRKEQSVRDYLVIVKSWMFLVAFALMLGLGALIGTFINQQMIQSSPSVAGISSQAK